MNVSHGAASNNEPKDIVCSLAPSGNHTQDDGRPENPSCLQVKLVMSAPPKVGETQRLTVQVQANQGLSGSVPVAVNLPAGIAFASLAGGFRQEDVADALSVNKAPILGDGSVDLRAVGSVNVMSGQTSSIVFSVKPLKAGSGIISARAEMPAALKGPDMLGGNSALYLSYGLAGDPNGTHWGVPRLANIPVRAVSTSIPVRLGKPFLVGGKYCPGTQNTLPKNSICPSSPGLAEEVQKETGTHALGKVHAASTACSKGRFLYSDQAGVVRPAVNLAVHAYDVNSTWDDELASGLTDWNGDFNICYDNSEHSVWGSGTADIQLRFKTRNTRWEVKNYSDGNYVINTATHEQSNGSTRDWGDMTASSSSFQRALHAFDLYNQGWNFSATTSPGAGDCWTSGDCSRRKVLYESGEDPWPHYGGSGGDAVSLPSDGPDYYWVVLHELGHNVMAHAYSGGIPSPTNCPDPHYLTRNEDPVCAWVEGWPTWWAGEVMSTPILDGYGGDVSTPSMTMETFSWQNYNSRHRGSNVEGRVASALWDLSDSANEGSWDRESLGFSKLWTTFLNHDDSNWADYVGSLGIEGVPIHDSDFLSTSYGNTIDRVADPFRDPLGIAWQSRPIPPVSAPSLTSMPSGASDTPRDTSNYHNWVWERPVNPSGCGDSVRIESLIPNSEYYRVTSSGNPFNFVDWRLDAYANQGLTTSLGMAETGTSQLKTVGSLTLNLPDYPRKLYIRVKGTATSDDGHVSWSYITEPLINHYRIHAVKCFGLLSWAKDALVGGVNWASLGLAASDSGKHSVLVRPDVRTSQNTNTRIRIWRQSQDSSCQQEPGASPCRPALVAQTQTTADRGKGKRLSFDTQKGTKYKIEWENLSGGVANWIVSAD